MAVYLVSGKLGSGKSLACVGRIRDYLKRDAKVATNLDIFMDGLAHPMSKRYVTRLPDHPNIDDMRALGRGQEGIEESNNGLIVLDECGTWLNTRSWNDKGRSELIDWMLHSRKLGWDIIFIVQDISIIDKQVRTTLIEFLVICKRMDRLAVPFITPIFKLLGLNIRPPKIHLALVKYGTERESPVSDRWIYQAKDLYKAYDTRQVFKPDTEFNGVLTPHVGLHSVLSAWHLKGRYLEPNKYPLSFWLTLPAVLLVYCSCRVFQHPVPRSRSA